MDAYEKRLRYGHSEFFGRIAVPFYSTTVRVDVTELYARAKARGIPFYYAMMWATMRAVNSVPAYLYEVRDGTLQKAEKRDPSYTYLYEEEIFGIAGVAWQAGESPEAFTERCRRAEANNKSPLPTLEADAAGCDVYLSSLPWFDYEHVAQEFDLNGEDSTPRILWGRFTKGADDRLTLAYTVQVNHRFIDGIHIKQLLDALRLAMEEF